MPGMAQPRSEWKETWDWARSMWGDDEAGFHRFFRNIAQHRARAEGWEELGSSDVWHASYYVVRTIKDDGKVNTRAALQRAVRDYMGVYDEADFTAASEARSSPPRNEPFGVEYNDNGTPTKVWVRVNERDVDWFSPRDGLTVLGQILEDWERDLVKLRKDIDTKKRLADETNDKLDFGVEVARQLQESLTG